MRYDFSSFKDCPFWIPVYQSIFVTFCTLQVSLLLLFYHVSGLVDFMASCCDVCIPVHIHVNNVSKNTRPRDMLFLLKDTLSIQDDKLSMESRFVCSPEPIEVRYPHRKFNRKFQHFDTISSLTIELSSLLS